MFEIWMDEGAAGGTPGGEGGNEGGEALNWESWIASQEEPVRNLLESHTSGLKSALVSERENRKKLEKDLRELAGKAEQGSEAQTKLAELANQMSEADRKAEFYEQAHAAGVRNLKLAFMAALQGDLFDKHGRVNFVEMKKEYPELFGGVAASTVGNAGAGTGSNSPKKSGMNDFIRKAAGRAP